MKDMREKYIETFADAANVDKSHDIDEYLERFGDEYNDGLLCDFEESDFEGGSIEFRDDIVYWLIDGRYYETDIQFSSEESTKGGTDSEVTEGAEGKRRPGFEWVIYDASEEMEKKQRAPIVAIRKTYVEAQSFINKNREKYGDLYADEVPEGKFKKGDDFWGPFDGDWNLIEGAKNCEGGCCDESKKRERETFTAGDPVKNIAAFNHMMGSDQGSQGAPLGESADEGESIWSGDYDKAHETWERIKSYLNEKKAEFQIWEIAPNREETLAIEGETAFTLYKASEGEYRIGLGAEASAPESEDFEGEVDSVLRNVIPEDQAKEETEEAKAEAESPLDESLKEGIIDPKDRVSIHNAALKIAKELNKPMLYGYLKASGKEYSIKPVPYNGDEQGTCARYSAQTLMVAYPNKDYIEESLDLKWISQSDDTNRQFIDIINFLDFGLKENEDGTFGLKDYQGANLGGIEDEKFESAQDILNRLSETYFNDYFLNPGEDPKDADSENVKNLNAIHTFIENDSANVDLSKAYEIQKEKDGGK